MAKPKKKKKKARRVYKSFFVYKERNHFPFSSILRSAKTFNSSKSQSLASPPSALTLMPRPPPPHINPHFPLPSNPRFPFPTPPPPPQYPDPISTPSPTPPKNPPPLHLPFPPSNRKKKALSFYPPGSPARFGTFGKMGGWVELCSSWG